MSTYIPSSTVENTLSSLDDSSKVLVREETTRDDQNAENTVIHLRSSSRSTFTSSQHSSSWHSSSQHSSSRHSSISTSFSLSSTRLPPWLPSIFSTPEDAKNVVTFDGGGAKGLGSVMIFAAIVQKLRPGALSMFIDSMGGANTGGIFAFMLGVVGMSVQQCLEVYPKILKKLYKRSKPAQVIQAAFTGSRNSTTKQRKVLGEVIEAATGSTSTPLHASSSKPLFPTFVAAVGSENIGQPTLFSTYDTESDVSILDAACATCSAPTLFNGTKIDGRLYFDGALGFSNPAELAVKELPRTYGPTAFAHTVISIGTGLPPPTRFKKARLGNFVSTREVLTRIATDSENVHQRMADRMPEGSYFRFNPPGLEKVELNDWKAVPYIIKVTQEYLARPEVQSDICAAASRLCGERTISSDN